MIYFIIGYKNSGKTTFGRKLADRLHLEFIDLDDFIEKKTGDTIPNIYNKLGEEKFRHIEWKALKELSGRQNLVVSTGGGVPCNCNNMSIMESCGVVIYLKRDSRLLVERLKKVTNERPIVLGKSEQELEQYIASLRERCEHHYLRAKFIIEEEDPDLDKIVMLLKG
jgi:shikimate kinase